MQRRKRIADLFKDRLTRAATRYNVGQGKLLLLERDLKKNRRNARLLPYLSLSKILRIIEAKF